MILILHVLFSLFFRFCHFCSSRFFIQCTNRRYKACNVCKILINRGKSNILILSRQTNAFLFYCQRMGYCWQLFAMTQQTRKPYCRSSNQVKLPNHWQRLCLALCSLHHTKHNQRNDTNRYCQLNQTGKNSTNNRNYS